MPSLIESDLKGTLNNLNLPEELCMEVVEAALVARMKYAGAAYVSLGIRYFSIPPSSPGHNAVSLTSQSILSRSFMMYTTDDLTKRLRKAWQQVGSLGGLAVSTFEHKYRDAANVAHLAKLKKSVERAEDLINTLRQAVVMIEDEHDKGLTEAFKADHPTPFTDDLFDQLCLVTHMDRIGTWAGSLPTDRGYFPNGTEVNERVVKLFGHRLDRLKTWGSARETPGVEER